MLLVKITSFANLCPVLSETTISCEERAGQHKWYAIDLLQAVNEIAWSAIPSACFAGLCLDFCLRRSVLHRKPVSLSPADGLPGGIWSVFLLFLPCCLFFCCCGIAFWRQACFSSRAFWLHLFSAFQLRCSAMHFQRSLALLRFTASFRCLFIWARLLFGILVPARSATKRCCSSFSSLHLSVSCWRQFWFLDFITKVRLLWPIWSSSMRATYWR